MNETPAIALHRHMEQAYLALAQLFRPVDWHQERGATWFFSEYPWLLCNGVLRTETDSNEADNIIRHITRQAQEKQHPFLWLVGPATQPAHLPGRLEAFGLVHDETVGGMLLNMNAFPPEEQTAHLSRIAVTTPEQMDIWLQVWTSVFGFPDPVKQVFFEMAPSFIPQRSCQFYLGVQGTRPVATSLLFTEGEVAGIYAVATRPEVRMQGIGTLMTRMAVEEARRQGYEQITLQATSMGESLYRRLGFQSVCSFHTYRWMP